jgi:hypothetical protein
MKRGDQTVDRLYRTETTYVVLDDAGAPLAITVEAKLLGKDKPRVGDRLVIAYDPADPSEVVVLVSERTYAANLADHGRDLVQHGAEAPCEIVSAERTGRVSRPDPPPVRPTLSRRKARMLAAMAAAAQPNPAPETKLTLRVEPGDAEPFEVRLALWDRDLGLAPGLRGVLFYDPEEPGTGYPVFPTVQERAAGGDAVRLARDTFVVQLG